MNKVWLVTGSPSGFGRNFAEPYSNPAIDSSPQIMAAFGPNRSHDKRKPYRASGPPEQSSHEALCELNRWSYGSLTGRFRES